jgi:hypothetical protein
LKLTEKYRQGRATATSCAASARSGITNRSFIEREPTTDQSLARTVRARRQFCTAWSSFRYARGPVDSSTEHKTDKQWVKRNTLAVIAANVLALLVRLESAAGADSVDVRQPHDPVIYTEDVVRFYKVYDAAQGLPTAEELQRDYIDPGSPGLHHLAEIRNVTGVTIARALAVHPEIFSDAKRCMAALPRVPPPQRLRSAP